MKAARIWLLLLVVPALLAACAKLVPYRDLKVQASREDCADTYQSIDREDASTDATETALLDEKHAHCLRSSWEKHPRYDLFTVEFDDQGWLAGAAEEPDTAARQIDQLIAFLKSKIEGADGKPAQPLSIILYTHGWHHSADAKDGNVIAFRRLLANTVEFEKQLCLWKRGNKSVAPADCTEQEAGVANNSRVRSVVGIYVGWRGDSILGPGIRHTSIWDRKLTAEKVAIGSVQELYASIHNFWQQHSCHLKDEYSPDCVDARLLNVGHSFGGLITYRGLAPRLMTGIVETFRKDLKPEQVSYAYGFGDMTVLINPAFEGTRFEALARAASRRKYEEAKGNGEYDRSAQLPVLVVAQSKGDFATRTAFPLFRHVTTLLERSVGDEAASNLDTIGWNPRYVTHELRLIAKTPCWSDPGAPLFKKVSEEGEWAEGHLKNKMRVFNESEIQFCNGLVLKKSSDNASEHKLERPPFYPLWVIQTEKDVIADHNDFTNPHFVDFIRTLYYMVQRTTDHYLCVKQPAKCPGGYLKSAQ
jgi:hypothetical protein